MDTVKNFVKNWSGHGYERGETQKFWLQFLREVMKVSKPDIYVDFEVKVKVRNVKFIDAYFQDTKVIVEQKSLTESLTQAKIQSDGEILTPYEQAKRYGENLPLSMHPRWIITCNFKEFLIYDMENFGEPTKILLEELPQKFHAFDFLIDDTKTKIRLEVEISIKAGEIVNKLYDSLLAQYINPKSDETLQSLNKLCVRLVFCLYAESAGIFGKHKIFCDCLEKTNSNDMRQKLISIFEVLNTPENLRDPYLDDDLKNFPYVNGGLFEDNIEIPKFDYESWKILLHEAGKFNWAGISPTIFGALFESTLNPTVRKNGGMHYTSPENIHKVIDSLFLDALKAEFAQIKSLPPSKARRKNLYDFQNKLANLKFFDPACGSGNFLTETFLSLRRLENDILKELLGSQIQMGNLIENPVKVSINQFYGVEINDFAVSVAKTALWISELQMIQETQEVINRNLDFLPLKSYPNISEDNALTIDWKKILPKDLNFIMGNPPFFGKSFQTKKQKEDMEKIFEDVKGYGNLDYVACWYKKSADFIQGKNIRCAFVATNSICQGIAVPPLWNFLFSKNIVINFAYQTFKWQSESTKMAQVHVVIIGFSTMPNDDKKIFSVKVEKDDNGKNIEKIIATPAQNINAYLLNAPNIIVEPRNKSLFEVPPMIVGSCPTDGGGFLIDAEEYENFIKKEPLAKKYIRPYIGSEEFINGKKRYCLWLRDCPPNELRQMKLVYERVKAVKNFRLASKKEQTRRRAETPTLFAEDRFVDAPAIFMPMVSSENRRYVPIGFIPAGVVSNNKSLFIPNADNFIFGVLISKVHMAWMKTVCGRLKSDFSYSATIVYNNFVWCAAGEKQRLKIESTAQKILDVRAKYPAATLADLYDETTMPADLRRAHRENDLAVLAAYGFRADLSEPEIVAELMKKYSQLTK